jgi:SAM-dependent methyltransferase
MNPEEIKKAVKERYTKVAINETSCCSSSCSCGNNICKTQSENIGYSKEELNNLPESAVLGLGCGNPTAFSEINEGDTVVDLGSGAGIDVFLASKKVGTTGKVIGIDMTEEMVNKARNNAEKNGYTNVEFIQSELESMPLEDKSVDVIISNCVINLCPDKEKAFKEGYRILKKGGKMFISDLVTEGKLPDKVKKDFSAWSECIAGAMEKQEYLKTIKKAGFEQVKVISEKAYQEPGLSKELNGKIVSLNIKALKV